VIAILLVAVAVGRSTPAGGTGEAPVRDFGPVTVHHEPLVVNGSLCGQCR